jgi:hypothetical protein
MVCTLKGYEVKYMEDIIKVNLIIEHSIKYTES